MSKEFILLSMVFMHIVDDYYLQGILASMKQKSWWKTNAPQKLYRHDYIMALVMHRLSWAFMIMLPIAISLQLNVSIGFATVLICNALIHGFVDDLKANRLKINLIIDQSIHVIQIIGTIVICVGVGMV